MYQFIIIVHVLLGLGVIGLVLIQQGKGADAGAAFAGGGSGSVFGAQGATSFLSRTTAILAALFFATSLGLAILSGHQNKPDDLMEQPEIENPLEDVPLIGDNQPDSNSAPVVPPTSETKFATETMVDNSPEVDIPSIETEITTPQSESITEATADSLPKVHIPTIKTEVLELESAPVVDVETTPFTSEIVEKLGEEVKE